jgi:hypothetical protein
MLELSLKCPCTFLKICRYNSVLKVMNVSDIGRNQYGEYHIIVISE